MGLILDTSVFIQAERRGARPEFSSLETYGETGIATITASELLVGLHRADSEKRRKKRSAFIDFVLEEFPIREFTLDVARVHAKVYAQLAERGEMIGAHDLIIAATALSRGDAVLTTNVEEFSRIRELEVLEFGSGN